MTSMPPALPHRRPGTEVGQRPEPVPGTCPACGARVRPAQPWCSLCHHRLGVAPARPAAPAVPPAAAPAAPEAVPAVPAARHRAPEPSPEPVPESEPGPEAGPELAALPVEAMLVELSAVEHRSPVPPALAQLVGSGPLGKLALGGAALLAVLTLLVTGFTVLGLFV